ncbi:MAG: pentapeptide repeat-containing protein [Roseofilum sp. SBFL]|uniref:pentapeptide repeat-containing protein n=1 Tax=Roseofilum sp. SBFL TaxID=2821496 RepID=UPI001B25DC0B|nr:pentapeptide repeat-containing protein [Roseofilum sp. SBFL]MBP0044136.1 pentapeptide repeat-containing protein [Roseofilum sp. SBFL]
MNVYIAWRAMKGDPRDAWIRSAAVAFAAWGGTSFRGTTLMDVDFTGARLKNCDFRHAHLLRTRFNNTQKLDLARPGQTLLANTTVRNLLINPESGYKLDLCKANLRGAFLAGANLESANLKQADLSEADLSGANLKDANLTESTAIGTNFTHAYLTGACLEAWNIEPTTIFKDVDCQYIYLLEHPNPLGSRERRPHNPDKVFAPGDFENLYTELMHTIEILLKGGMNPEAFAAALQKVMEENPEITFDSIQSIQKKGQDVLVTLEVPPETDKAQVEQHFDAAYVARLEVQAELYQLHGQQMKQQMDDIIAKLPLLSPTINVTSSAESKAMSDNPSISVGGDNKGNLAGGDLDASGAVQNIDNQNSTLTTTLNQLPDIPPEPDKPDLKAILTELQIAINNSELNDEDKTEALEQLNIIGEAGQNPQDNGFQKAAKRATTMLKGLITGLPAAAGLVKAVQEFLPMISDFFDLG